MSTHTDNSTDKFMTEAEEQKFGENLRKTLIYQNPNPEREGCPDPKTIRDLAFHKKIGSPQVFEQITNHMAECSACVRDALTFAEEYKEQKKKKQRARLWLAAAAAVVLAVGLWAVLQMQPKQEMAAKSPAAPVQAPSNPLVADAGNQEDRQPEISKLEPVLIELPSRWRGAASTERVITLPRRQMQMEIRLPIGSSDGKYKVRIVDKSGAVRKTAEGVAHTVSGVTSLKFPLDISNLSRGDYKLSVLEPGLDVWSDYPIYLN